MSAWICSAFLKNTYSICRVGHMITNLALIFLQSVLMLVFALAVFKVRLLLSSAYSLAVISSLFSALLLLYICLCVSVRFPTSTLFRPTRKLTSLPQVPLAGSLVIMCLFVILLGLTGTIYGLVISSLTNVVHEAMQMALGTFFPALLLSGVLWPKQAVRINKSLAFALSLLRFDFYCLVTCLTDHCVFL